MNKLKLGFSLLSITVLALINLCVPLAHADFNQNLLIDDSVFNNTGSMTAGQINSWLNTNFPSSCISTNNGFSSPDPTGYNPSAGFTYGGNVSGGQVIADAAQAYGLNPEVLISTLQKESSVVSGTASYHCQYINTAMGYDCPDSGSCPRNPATESGFSKQVIHAAWLFKFGQQRSLGNTGWDVQLTNSPQNGDVWNNSDDPTTCYGGPMTQGTLSRGCGQSAVAYDGNTTIDGTSVHMGSGATAALYWYTPHFSGNQNFVNIFTGWFGSPTSSCGDPGNVNGALSGDKVIAYQYTYDPHTNLAFSALNNTGSTCAELHVWNPGEQSWEAHLATGMKASDPSLGTVVAMNSPHVGTQSLVYVLYNGSQGTVEIHKFSPNLQTFPGYYDTATNLGAVNPANGTFVSGDFLGRGSDQLAFVLYNGSTGHAEVHLFNPGMNQAVGYYDTATDLSGVTASTGTFVAGDFLGNGRDQLAYILYNGSTGHVEVHLFNPGLNQAIGYHDVITDLSGVNNLTGSFVAGNFLGIGNGTDQLAYVLDRGGSGNTEVHLFNPGLNQAIGYQDNITNLPGFSPTQ